MVREEDKLKEVSIPRFYKAPTETASFAKDPVQYVEKNVRQHGPVFGGRIVTWPVVFVCSYEGVRVGLGENGAFLDSQKAYDNFGGLSLYGENVLFTSKNSHSPLKQKLQQCPILDMKSFGQTSYAQTIDQVIELFVQQLKSSEELNVYDRVKSVTSDILAITFWGADFQPSLNKGSFAEGAKEFRALQSKFWRASVSTGVKVDLLGFKSAFAKGAKAKEQLIAKFKKLDGTRQKECKCPFSNGCASDGLSEEERAQHMLMFSSSMVSKAMASVVASFMLQMIRSPDVCVKLRQMLVENSKDESYLSCVVDEVLRLHPPVMGCCRVATKDLAIEGNKIPEGSNVWFSFASANRDLTKFKDPDVFNPDRWAAGNAKELSAHLTFGAFDHTCVGTWGLIVDVKRDFKSNDIL